ncbi:MAG: hypothetical protein R2853_18820 [Thermomicrobiales bacterium]
MRATLIAHRSGAAIAGAAGSIPAVQMAARASTPIGGGGLRASALGGQVPMRLILTVAGVAATIAVAMLATLDRS